MNLPFTSSGSYEDRTSRTRLFAVVVGVLLVAVLGYVLVSGNLFGGGGAPAKQKIVVAKQAIPAYTAITTDMVETTEVTSAPHLAGAADNPQAILGSISQTPIGAGQIVYKNQVSRIDLIAGGNPLFMTLQNGQRAMSLRVDDVTGVANLLRVGNRVDIIAVYNGNEGTADTHGIATTVLQNVPILAIGKQYESTPGTPAPKANKDGSSDSSNTSSSDQSSSSSSDKSEYSTVTFQLSSLQDGEKLALAMNLDGVKIYLALRSQNDNEIVQLPTINSTEIFS